MGFHEKEATDALFKTKGDADAAIVLLMEGGPLEEDGGDGGQSRSR